MTCNPCKPRVKILKTGVSLEAQKVVRAVEVAGASIRVTNTDGTTYDLELPKAEPADVISQYIAQNIEVVEGVSDLYDGWGNSPSSLFGISIAGVQHQITRVGRIKGTNWLVFGSSTMT